MTEFTAVQRSDIINQVFKTGSVIEVSFDYPQFRKSWYRATVLRLYTETIQIKFHNIFVPQTDKQLIQFVDVENARPIPPPGQPGESWFRKGRKVNFYQHGGWWEGYIGMVHRSIGKFSVILVSNGAVRQFSRSELRIHMIWEYNRWVLPALHPGYSNAINNNPESTAHEFHPDESKPSWPAAAA